MQFISSCQFFTVAVYFLVQFAFCLGVRSSESMRAKQLRPGGPINCWGKAFQKHPVDGQNKSDRLGWLNPVNHVMLALFTVSTGWTNFVHQSMIATAPIACSNIFPYMRKSLIIGYPCASLSGPYPSIRKSNLKLSAVSNNIWASVWKL